MSQPTCVEPPVVKTAVSSRSFASLRNWLLRAVVAAPLLWVGWFVCNLYVFGNVHEVIPGQFIRGAQPSGPFLEKLIDRYGIRTVLNVRGCCYSDPWYNTEAAVCQRRGVQMHDLSFSAVHYPSRHELRNLIDILDRAERPIFVHCRHGADRTGIASMAAQLLIEERSFADARPQLGLRFGHTPIGKPATLDRFVQLYEDWLQATQQQHTAARFRHWLLQEYRGAECDAAFEKVERLFDEPHANKTLNYRVVVRNTSSAAWQFHPIKTAGHHVTFAVFDATHQRLLHEGRAGLFERTVAPGAKIEVNVVVPPLAPGNYYLQIDMIEEGHCWFHQTGSELWEEELTIRE